MKDPDEIRIDAYKLAEAASAFIHHQEMLKHHGVRFDGVDKEALQETVRYALLDVEDAIDRMLRQKDKP